MGENRVGILPEDLAKLEGIEGIYIEEGYAKGIGIKDEDYKVLGANLVKREEIYKQDILVDVKLSDADYIDQLDEGKILFGWAHAAQSIDFTTSVLNGKHTVYAWEDMNQQGRYIFYRNREIAGEAAIMHAYTYYGSMPYDTKVAIIGNGQTARGAMRVLYGLGVKQLDVFTRRQEELFRELMYDYDVIVNCVLWDISRTDRLIYKEDLKKMKSGSMIIDISCDPELEIETSRPTTIEDPVYMVDGVLHYAVDNTPALYSRTVSKVLSENLVNYYNDIRKDGKEDVLKDALIIDQGEIIDASIRDFREKRGL